MGYVSGSFFDVLGVTPNATDAEVKSAYHRRVKETHPDAGGSAEAFREVQEAYETLSTAHRRSMYESWLANSSATQAPSRGIEDDMNVAVLFHQLDAMRTYAVRQLLIGLAWAVGAIGLSIATYASARNGGGTRVIFWGPAIFGTWRALRSIAAMVRVAGVRRNLEAQIRAGFL